MATGRSEVYALLLPELIDQVVDDPFIEVVATEAIVPGGRSDSKTPSPKRRMETSNVRRVVDEHRRLALLIDTVGRALAVAH